MQATRSRCGILATALLGGVTMLATTLAVIPPAHASGTSPSVPPTPTLDRKEQVLFRSGTAGYGCFRIPTLIRTKTSLLAFAEARTSPSCADRGPMDIVVRRSTNDGRTWGPIKVVTTGSSDPGTGAPGDAEAPYTRGNPVPLYDREKDWVFLVSTGEPAVPGGERHPYVQKSIDDGLTFGAPKRLKRPSGAAKGWFGTGPSHGIQLQKDPYKNRLVFGAYESPDSRTQLTGVYYSDDHGENWLTSATANSLETKTETVNGEARTTTVLKPTEPAVAELSDGSVYVAARNEVGDDMPHRTYAIGTEGGANVGKHSTAPSLVTPQIQASVLALQKTYQKTAGDTLIAAAPSDPNKREKFQIRYSVPDAEGKNLGKTWTAATKGLINEDRMKPPAEGGENYPDWSGYSDLAEMDSGEIGLVYEGGSTLSAQHIYFKRFYPQELGIPGEPKVTANPQPAPLPGPTTPDSTPQANDAYLAGNASLLRKVGEQEQREGLYLDGAGDYADIPYGTSIDPGEGDVSYSLRFRLDATAPVKRRTLMWAYGYNAVKPQVWARVHPVETTPAGEMKPIRVEARVEGENGKAVTLTAAIPELYTSGAWYRMTLVRSGSTATLSLTDAGGKATTDSKTHSGILGSLTADTAAAPGGIRLGAKPDSTASDALQGTLDDFRVYRAALGPEDVKALAAGQATTRENALAAHLAFQVTDDATPVGTPTKVAIADDVSGNGADATLLLAQGAKPSNTSPGDARMGRYALNVDAHHRGLEVPYVPAADPGAGDFTHTLWFRYQANQAEAPVAATPPAVLLWGYGVGTDQAPTPSLWVRTDPEGDRIHALAETDNGKVHLSLADTDTNRVAFGDNKWHLLTVTREGESFSVQVDGALAQRQSGTGLKTRSSFTAGRPSPLGLRLGSRPGDTEILNGQLDEYRLYHRALSATEVQRIAADNSGISSYPADDPGKIWWSMEHGTTQVHDMYNRGTDNGPATPDRSAHGNNAYVRGTATSPPPITGAGGRFGGGLHLDGTDDRVELPYTDSEALGSSDFTLATWVRYDPAATTGTRTITWAYGAGAGNRQLWLRADPKEKRLMALIETDGGSAFVEVPDDQIRGAKDDYHHVVLIRANGKLTLSLTSIKPGSDGAAPTTITITDTADAPAGSLTYDDGFATTGFQLGARIGGGEHFTGSLDEFALVRRALGPSELKALREGNTHPAADAATVAHLSFEKITTTGYARM